MGLGPEQVYFGPTGSVWVLESMHKRFYNRSLDGSENMFIKAGEVKQRKELGGNRREPRQGYIGSLRNRSQVKELSQHGAAVSSLESHSKGVHKDRFLVKSRMHCCCSLLPWLQVL